MPTIQSDGCRIVYDVAGDPRRRTVVLIHGGAAHAGWWTWMVRQLVDRYQVVTFDLSGHGASDHREDYSAALWAAEVEAVSDAVGAESVALVGHSMGGLVAIAAAARLRARSSAAILVDSRIPLKGLPRPSTDVRHFATREDALGRFRLAPPETAASPQMLAELAERGLTESAVGWRWRFDPAARRRFVNDEVLRALASLACPVGYIYGTESQVGGPDTLQALRSISGQPVPYMPIERAHHHVPLDRPRACARGVRSLLDEMPG